MTKKIWLAVILGVLLGVGVGYTPNGPPSAMPRAQLLMQSQPPTYTQSGTAPSYNVVPVLIALAVGLLVATPAFFVAKRGGK